MDEDSPATVSHDSTSATRPVVGYHTPRVGPQPAPKLASLVWCSLPALVGAALLLETIRRIRADPADVMAGAGTFVLLVPLIIVSGITSGAVVLAVVESRKTVATVTLMTLNLLWFAACIAFFILRRVG